MHRGEGDLDKIKFEDVGEGLSQKNPILEAESMKIGNTYQWNVEMKIWYFVDSLD